MENKRTRVFVSAEANYKIKGQVSPPVTVLVREVSRFGLRFVTADVLEKDTVLELFLKLTNISDPIYVVGKVLWQRVVLSKFLRDTCIKFSTLEASHEGWLINYISQLSESKGVSRKHMRCSLITDVLFSCTKNNTQGKCVSGDIGVEGMRLLLLEKMEIDTELLLSFAFNDKSSTISILGKVVWYREGSSKMAGIKFINIAEENRKKITGYITKNFVS
ncbi:MAG: PilZ domain-containing protein [Candidatus Omnitrophica bacterium]|nr:PilZ domain-containing protein [Candidatus Omnitrophota bacterium]